MERKEAIAIIISISIKNIQIILLIAIIFYNSYIN